MAKRDELKAKAAELRRTLAKIDKLTGSDAERDRNAERMRAKRDAARVVVIPPCEDRARRERLEADDIAWLMWYFAPESGSDSPFTYEFTTQQREMIEALRIAITEGGDQAIAASRGEGKSTLAERMILKYTLSGMIRFSVLFAATGQAAENALDAIKAEVETNERLLADYPEVCVPVQALENTPNRAHYQTVTGHRHDNGKPYEAASSKFSWCGQEVVFPLVPGSPAARSIIATRGLDSAVRGIKKKGRRVDVAIIDDPDTEETARSEDQAKKLETRIDRGIAGLGGQKRRCSRLILTTLQSRVSVSYQFTDTVIKPSWNGKRLRFLVKQPDRTDLWDEYVRLRQLDWQENTTASHEFYVSHREEMDAGAEVSNPNRYVAGELSALQFYYNEVARLGPEAVATEYDNNPPEETGPIESGLTATRIQRQVSGYQRKAVPPGCTILVRGIDVGKKLLHWVVKAFMPDATGYVVDYGIQPVYGTRRGTDEGLDHAIKAAIEQLLAVEEQAPYFIHGSGELIQVKQTLVDAGYRTDGVYAACKTLGLDVKPVMGCGTSAGCVRRSFSPHRKTTATQKPGHHYNLEQTYIKEVWRVDAEADHWKRWEHDRWMTEPGKPGCMYIFGEASDDRKLTQDQYDHKEYGKQIVAEIEADEMVRGVVVRKFINKSDKNHFLDASYYADVAAAMHGIRLMRELAKPIEIKSKSLAELAALAKGA